jgi:hypothetical protein
MSTENGHEARAARNELVFRTVNEQIMDITERFATLLTDVDIVCECTDPTCTGAIRVRTSEFLAIRETKSDFIVLPGHEQLDVEQVVARHENYLVVRKSPSVVARVAPAR